MEELCVKALGVAFGFEEQNIDGMLNAGGSASNTTAFLAGRHHHFPHVREHGWQPDDKPIVFAPSQMHYSSSRAAMIAGIGK